MGLKRLHFVIINMMDNERCVLHSCEVKMSSLIETLRAACLERGASGIHGIGR